MTTREDNRVAITQEARRLIRSEIKRTGITAIMLLSGADMPVDLTAREVNRWTSGLSKSARASDLDYVLRTWAAIPDRVATIKAKRGRPHGTPALGRIEITEAMADHLRSEFSRTQLDYISVLQNSEAITLGLKPRMVRGWLYRDMRARKEHWDFVIGLLASVPDYTSQSKSKGSD